MEIFKKNFFYFRLLKTNQVRLEENDKHIHICDLYLSFKDFGLVFRVFVLSTQSPDASRTALAAFRVSETQAIRNLKENKLFYPQMFDRDQKVYTVLRYRALQVGYFLNSLVFEQLTTTTNNNKM